MENFITSLKLKAENQVKVKFPAKIVELSNLLDSADFSIKDPGRLNQEVNVPVPDPQAIARGLNNHSNSIAEEHEASSPPTRGKRRRVENSKPVEDEPDKVQGTKVLALVSGTVHCNSNITRLIEVVKPHIRELVEDSNLVRLYFCSLRIWLFG